LGIYWALYLLPMFIKSDTLYYPSLQSTGPTETSPKPRAAMPQ
jgi:hypothetical protein